MSTRSDEPVIVPGARVRALLRRWLPEEFAPHEYVPILPRTSLRRRVCDEVRWSFTPPRHWLTGIAANLALSLIYLVISPLTVHKHGWAVVVGTYFSTFILADVTTTNVLGLDGLRVRASLAAGTSLGRILLTKNLALLVIIGLPTLLLTAVLTLEHGHLIGLDITVPDVALPILAWLGVGNLISVILAVETHPLMHHWRRRRQWRTQLVWLGHLALPYGLYYLIAPIDGTMRDPLLHLVHVAPDIRSWLHAAVGLAVWILGTAVTLAYVRRRGLNWR